MSADRHSDELTLMRLLDGELPPERERAARDHLEGCAPCRARYEALSAETSLLRAALREADESPPERVSAYGDVSWVAVVAIAGAALGFSTFWSRFVTPLFERLETLGFDGSSLITAVLIRGVLWRGWSDMAWKFLEVAVLFCAVLATGGILQWAWRRGRTHAASVSLLHLVLLSAAVIPDGASAAVIALDEGNYVLRASDVVDNDLVVSGESIRIEGVVTGDLLAAARRIEVSGEVKGDVIAFAEEIEITGEVGGNLRTGSRLLDIEGKIARNVTSAGESIRLSQGAEVLGSLTVASKTSVLDGGVGRDLTMVAQEGEINAPIGGGALMAGERLTVGPGGAIGGEAKFYGATEPEVSGEARLDSPITFERVEDDDEDDSRFGWIASLLFFWMAAFVLGAVVMLLTPATTKSVLSHVPHYGKSLLAGLLSWLVVLSTALLMMITLVGLPLGLVTLFLWALGTYLAQAYVGAFIGREVLGAPSDSGQAMVRLALGLFLIQIAKRIPIVGDVISIVITLWGFGAITLWVLERFSRRGAPTPPAPEPASEGAVS